MRHQVSRSPAQHPPPISPFFAHISPSRLPLRPRPRCLAYARAAPHPHGNALKTHSICARPAPRLDSQLEQRREKKSGWVRRASRLHADGDPNQEGEPGTGRPRGARLSQGGRRPIGSANLCSKKASRQRQAEARIPIRRLSPRDSSSQTSTKAQPHAGQNHPRRSPKTTPATPRASARNATRQRPHCPTAPLPHCPPHFRLIRWGGAALGAGYSSAQAAFRQVKPHACAAPGPTFQG